MMLKIGSTPYCQWRLLTPILEGFDWSESQSLDAEGWYENKQAASLDEKHILFVSRPETAIAEALQKGAEPKAALSEWQESLAQLIAFYKANRRCTVVFELANAANNAQACINMVNNHLGLSFSGSVPSLKYVRPEPNMNQLLAYQLVSQTHELEVPLAELDACITPLSDEVFLLPALNITALHELQKNISGREAEHSKEENELLLLQLCQVQEELETYYSRNNELTQKAEGHARSQIELDSLKVRVDIGRQQIEKLQWAKAELLEANSLFRATLTHLEFDKKNDSESLNLKEQLVKKDQALQKISATTEFNVYENEGRCFASPLDVNAYIDKGMPPEAIAGEFMKGRGSLALEHFSGNPTFVKFLQWVISRHIQQYPDLRVVTEQKLSGESQVPDLRGLGPAGELNDEDCLGVVEFLDGKMLNYKSNEQYQPYTEKGYMQLDPWLQEKYMQELLKLTFNDAQSQ